LRAAFEISGGRFRVEPFTVAIGQATMNVSGSNGLDQSLDYALRIQVPRGLIGPEANQAMSGILSKAAAAGLNIQTAPEIALGAKIGGTVTNPSLSLDLAGAASSATQAVQQAAEEKVKSLTDTARQKAQAAVDTAAARVVREAQEKADQIRARARALADTVKQTAQVQADSLVAKAGNDPLKQAAAKLAADRLRKEGDNRAAQIVRTADAQADSLVAAARRTGNAP
ncbi:MAG TPA: AsmA-like C-terminal region-containing protein, partial [Gemmatimonadales bacterium]|nr:AsmA-like C-terminal region-containing protein [Gemmatimonadales bacterium]